mmetsp:Transcript_17105/g.20600  ORF Transcript_17105/g.20600 Transcript_17105/m.20600 type:complete len:110 (-) Transcript_17105:146-475(-)
MRDLRICSPIALVIFRVQFREYSAVALEAGWVGCEAWSLSETVEKEWEWGRDVMSSKMLEESGWDEGECRDTVGPGDADADDGDADDADGDDDGKEDDDLVFRSVSSVN